MEECPYLEKKELKSICGASITAFTPADESDYCSTEEHYRCPMLISHMLRAAAGKRN